jgi:hypothetical protein
MLSVWNPDKEWWGEGDHRFYIDGSPTPAIHGTGTEDYFGAAFAYDELYEHPYIAQTLCEGPSHSNYTSLLRWHMFDRIPFEKSLKFTLENYSTDKEYAATSYWYSNYEGTDDFVPVPVEKRLPRTLRTGLVLANAFEGEQLLVIGSSDPNAQTIKQKMEDFEGQWSLNTQLLWKASKIGEWIELAGLIGDPGTYELIMYPTKGPDYGIVQLSQGGKKLGKPFDGYAAKTTPAGAVSLGKFDISRGLPEPIRVEMIGQNEKSTGYNFGVDAIRLAKKESATKPADDK